ncbi:hypothetical protein DINM_020287 [Dirofilaria immitis]|nr:hypothetical protein [Dirofilaria immitis]
MEIWDDEKAIPFEYPAAIFSDRCTGTAPLPLFKNTSITCLPDWDDKFDKKHCIDLKYINVSYYLHKYSTKKNNNRTIVSMESIPEKNHPVYWLHWNGTACINAVSSILIKFITHDGILEDISANVHYANITNQSYSRQSYRFDAIFIEISSTSSNTMRIAKPIGYDMGQIIEIDNEKEFLIPYGMECDDREQQVNIRFGIQINTACRLRITTCAQLLTQIQYLLDKWNSIIVYGLPNNKNETITMQNDRLSSSQMKKMDESCEITTALSMQFAYVRFGNVFAYSHRFQIILYVAFAIENTVSLGGILGLKALTGDMPYLGYGNPWITYPRIAYGQADLYYPYSLWGYNRGFWSGYGNRRSIFGGYGNAGIYYPYVQYSYDSPSTSSSLIQVMIWQKQYRWHKSLGNFVQVTIIIIIIIIIVIIIIIIIIIIITIIIT